VLRLIGAGLCGLAVSFAGGLLWGPLFRTNLRVVPALPWSAVVMLCVAGLVHGALSRTKWFQSLAPAPEQGHWPWVAAAAVACCLISAVVVGLRFARLPADAFASSVDMHALPRLMQVVRVVMTAFVAAFFEELGFRGLIQGSLARRYGNVRSIGITGVLFYLAHLGHGWTHGDAVTVVAVAVPFLVGSALLGALAALTSSLGPSMVAHALTDLVLLPMEWTGKHRLDPVDVVGVDSHFVGWAAAVGVSSMVCVVLLGRLASRARRAQCSD